MTLWVSTSIVWPYNASIGNMGCFPGFFPACYVGLLGKNAHYISASEVQNRGGIFWTAKKRQCYVVH